MEGEQYRDRLKADPDLHWKAMLRHHRPRKPVIAAVEGYCVAGGTEILQGADIRVAGESATFGLFEVKRGLFPIGGSTVRLQRQIPRTRVTGTPRAAVPPPALSSTPTRKGPAHDRRPARQTLRAPLVVEFPFTRSLGPVQSAFLTGLRERRVLGACDRPAWIRGMDRIEPHSLGVRDLTDSRSTRLAAERAGAFERPVDTAELQAPFSSQEGVLRASLKLDDRVRVNPSGGVLAANPVMAAGLIRLGEAAARIHRGESDRALAHATSGPCLQQNLVAVLEGES